MQAGSELSRAAWQLISVRACVCACVCMCAVPCPSHLPFARFISIRCFYSSPQIHGNVILLTFQHKLDALVDDERAVVAIIVAHSVHINVVVCVYMRLANIVGRFFDLFQPMVAYLPKRCDNARRSAVGAAVAVVAATQMLRLGVSVPPKRW